MNTPVAPDLQFEQRAMSGLLDVLIRAGLILVLIMLCYRVFSPFLTLMVWAIILAVTIYPLHQALAARLRNRQGLASTVIVLLGALVIVAPTAVLVSSLGDSVHEVIAAVEDRSVKIPAPRPGIEEWPIVGKKIHAVWSLAYTDLPALIQGMQPKVGDLAKAGLAFVASIGGGLLQFFASIVVAGIIMAYGTSGDRASLRIFRRVMGAERAAEFVALATATIRAVAQGVIGVAFIQAIIIGLCLLAAGVPWAGVLAALVLVLGIAQIPAVIVTLPAIGYIWASGDYSTVAAVSYSVLLVVAGMADNVLKPLMLGRGVNVPMPVILFGALGGMATAGILGMFVGAALLALGYELFMSWVAANTTPGESETESTVHPAA